MEQVYIDGELAYPIWEVTAKWNQDGKQDPKYPKWYEGLSEGRIHNGTNYTQMCKTDKSQEQIEKEANEWWQKYSIGKLAGKNPSDLVLTIKFVRYETWCLTHFCHHTFDTGQTDQEVLNSFEKFVRRMEDMNERNGHYRNEKNDSSSLPYYCLMGAEDRWRWYGGTYESKTEAPCRCEGCKKLGLIRINH
jgi:hypothetical protein